MKLCYAMYVGNGHGHYNQHHGSDGIVFDKSKATCKRCLNAKEYTITSAPLTQTELAVDALKKYRESITKSLTRNSSKKS